jgi:ABC-type glycerol-3-phosphate transport system substrate-binding protein
MKKRYLGKGIFLFLALALSITALCDGTALGARGKTKIINRHDAEYMTEMVSQFNKTNRKIEIDYQIYTDNYLQALELALATGEGPDIFMDGAGAFEKLYPQGKLLPLNKYLSRANKKRFGNENFIEGINVFDGKIYSLPAIGTTPRLIYNKGILFRARSIRQSVPYQRGLGYGSTAHHRRYCQRRATDQSGGPLVPD